MLQDLDMKKENIKKLCSNLDIGNVPVKIKIQLDTLEIRVLPYS